MLVKKGSSAFIFQEGGREGNYASPKCLEIDEKPRGRNQDLRPG